MTFKTIEYLAFLQNFVFAIRYFICWIGNNTDRAEIFAVHLENRLLPNARFDSGIKN